jgi:hypothetical protein
MFLPPKDTLPSAISSEPTGFDRTDTIRFLTEHIGDLVDPGPAALLVTLADGSAVFINADAATKLTGTAPAGGRA